MNKYVNCRFMLLYAIFIALFFNLSAYAQEKNAEKTLSLNIFAITSDGIESAILKNARLLKEEDDIDSYPNMGFQIHCTLYMTQFSEKNLDRIIARIKALTAQKKSFSIETCGLFLTLDNWLFMNIYENPDLQALSDFVVRLLSPLRLKTNYVPSWVLSYPEKLEYIEKYGSPNVFGQFDPHFTFLARGDKEKITSFIGRHKDQEYSGNIKGQILGIGIGLAGKDGQIKESLRIFKFQE